MADNLKLTEEDIDKAIDVNAGIGGIKAENHNDALKQVLKKAGRYVGFPYLSQADTNAGQVPTGVLVWNNNAFNNQTAFNITVAKFTSDGNNIGKILSTLNQGSILHFKDFVGRSAFFEYQSHTETTDTNSNPIFNISVIGDVDNSNYTYQASEQEICIISFYINSSGSGSSNKITIGGNEFTYYAINGTISNIQNGDLALDGIISSTELGKYLRYDTGDPTLLASWEVLESIDISPLP